jgi:acyl-coenzyme A thioesterase PaaI-like protein
VREKQPNSRHCFVCGIENPIGLHLKFYETGPGEVTADLNLPDRYQGYPGIVHGGIIAAMLDEAAGRAHMGPFETPRFMFTAKMDVRYRKNVPVGQPLRLVGKAGPSKSRAAEACSAIYDQQGTLLADADVLLVNVPERMIQSTDLEALGWKVYPD